MNKNVETCYLLIKVICVDSRNDGSCNFSSVRSWIVADDMHGAIKLALY